MSDSSEPVELLATQRQKEYARQLGAEFSAQITRSHMSELIDQAVESETDKRYRELDAIEQRENDAWQKMRQEVLAEIDSDPEECRLSTADTSKVVEELFRRGLAAVLITVPWDDFDSNDLMGVSFAMSFCDNMPVEEAENMVKAAALTFWKRDGIDLVEMMEKCSATIGETVRLLADSRFQPKAQKGG